MGKDPQDTATGTGTGSGAASGVELADLPLRDSLRGMKPYGAPQDGAPARLNVNENPYPPSAALVEAIGAAAAQAATDMNRYPDRDFEELRRDLAAYFSRQTGVPVSMENVWAANGSNEVLSQLLQAFGGPGRRALGFQPSYSMHPLLCAGTDTTFVPVPRGADFAIDMDVALAEIKRVQPHVVFVTTPNNPTGGVTGLDELRRLLDAAPGILIVDEAYAEFSDLPSAAELLAEYPTKLVVSRTMSKAFAFAGGRLGYFVADPAFVDAALLVRLPYHLSVISQAAARAALSFADETLSNVAHLSAERDRIAEELRAYGYRVLPSESNFLMFGPFRNPAAAFERYREDGVLIRDNGIPGFLRMSVGLDSENDLFLQLSKRYAADELDTEEK